MVGRYTVLGRYRVVGKYKVVGSGGIQVGRERVQVLFILIILY